MWKQSSEELSYESWFLVELKPNNSSTRLRIMVGNLLCHEEILFGKAELLDENTVVVGRMTITVNLDSVTIDGPCTCVDISIKEHIGTAKCCGSCAQWDSGCKLFGNATTAINGCLAWEDTRCLPATSGQRLS